MDGDPRTPEEFFTGCPEGLAVLAAVRDAVAELGGARVRTTRSQVAFRRRRGFAWVWRPGLYVRSGVPAVLSIALPRRLDSPRVKEVVHPSRRTWMHHLELDSPGQVDDQVRQWLREAFDAAA